MRIKYPISITILFLSLLIGCGKEEAGGQPMTPSFNGHTLSHSYTYINNSNIYGGYLATSENNVYLFHVNGGHSFAVKSNFTTFDTFPFGIGAGVDTEVTVINGYGYVNNVLITVYDINNDRAYAISTELWGDSIILVEPPQ